MKLMSLLVSIALFGLFIMGGTLIWADTINKYDLNQSTANMESVFNSSSEIYDIAEGMSDDVSSDYESGEVTLNSMILGAGSALRLSWGSIGVILNILNVIARVVGVPAIFIHAATTIVLLFIVFAVIYLVFGRKG